MKVNPSPQTPNVLPEQILTFSAGTLQEMASTVVVTDLYGPLTYDPSHGDVYVMGWNPEQTLAFNVSSGHVVGSLTLPNTFGAFAMVYDPVPDTLALAGSCDGCIANWPHATAAIDWLNLSHGMSPQPSYSAFPGVGAALPWYVGGLGALGGLAIVVAVGVLRRRHVRAERRSPGTLDELRP